VNFQDRRSLHRRVSTVGLEVHLLLKSQEREMRAELWCPPALALAGLPVSSPRRGGVGKELWKGRQRCRGSPARLLASSRSLGWCAGCCLSSLTDGNIRLEQPWPPLWRAVTGAFARMGFLPVLPPRQGFPSMCLLPCWQRKAVVTCGVCLYPWVLGFLK